MVTLLYDLHFFMFFLSFFLFFFCNLFTNLSVFSFFIFFQMKKCFFHFPHLKKNLRRTCAVQTVRELNNLDDRERALIVFSQVTGRTKAMLDVLEITDGTAPAGLDRIWNLLDDVFEKLAHERLGDVLQHWETAHRLPVAGWYAHVRWCRRDAHEQDETVISHGALRCWPSPGQSCSSSLQRQRQSVSGTRLAAITKVNAS